MGMLALAAGRARAIQNPAYLNIDVTITNTVSVAVGGIQTSTQSVTWSGQATLANVLGAPMSVSNDSTYFASQWRFSTPTNSLDSTNGSAGWVIGATAGTDQVEVQAGIGPTGLASCAGASFASGVITPALSNTTPITYTQLVLAETTALGAGSAPDNTANNRMNAGSHRSLCWQLSMPTSTTLTDAQVVPIIVTAF